MADRPTVFISAVTSEFGTFRRAVSDLLLSKGIFPLVQEGFPTDYREVRAVLEDLIAQSDAVICLVGFAFGAEPRNRPDGEPRRSYTQLEYDIARRLNKKVYSFLSHDDARPCDRQPEEEPPLPELQAKHRATIRERDELRYTFESKDDLGTLVGKIPPVAQAGIKISTGRLRHGAEHLFGREAELERLDAAWEDERTHVVSIVAWGGVGKTSLVVEWMGRMSAEGWPGARRVFDWTFYSQGTREEGGASADAFVAKALEFFGDPDPAGGSPWDKGERLARLVAASRSLLVLDGLEPLQHPPGPVAGKLKDPTVEALLKGLAHQNPGLCILTTREAVRDLAPWHETTAPEWELKRLATADGVALLKRHGVRGADREFQRVVEEVQGHALTLSLLGRFLARAHGGDIRRRDRVRFEKADARIQGGHAFKVMAAYERWLADGGDEGRRQLAVLRLLGFFDRPAAPGCLAALRAEPVVAGLNEHLVGLGEEDWSLLVSDLEEAGLLRTSGYEPGKVRGFDEQYARGALSDQMEGYAPPPAEPEEFQPPSQAGVWPDARVLDAHPLVREYFAKRVREGSAEAWREGQRRLYEHLKASAPYWPEGLEGLQPLYQAVVHGCRAGLHEDARRQVYFLRILRGNESYSTSKLGALGSDLGAVACFFEEPWTRLVPSLREADQAWLLNEAAFSLRALGRLTEALEPMRATLESNRTNREWKNAAVCASNLSELELTLGRAADAVRDAEESVDFADRSGDAFQRMGKRTALADALHQAGRRDEARERLREAEGLQAEDQPEYPLLYSLPGFRYCDLLLGEAARAAWRQTMGLQTAEGHGQDARATGVQGCREVEERAAQTIEIAQRNRWLLDTALDHLTLGRAALYRAILEHAALPVPRSVLEAARQQLAAAVDGLRASGYQDDVPRGLLSRAWLRFVAGDAAGARADLEEAWEIAERGPMRLFMADVLLHRARLFRDGGALAEARTLLEDLRQRGYHRRDEELADAEQALGAEAG